MRSHSKSLATIANHWNSWPIIENNWQSLMVIDNHDEDIEKSVETMQHQWICCEAMQHHSTAFKSIQHHATSFQIAQHQRVFPTHTHTNLHAHIHWGTSDLRISQTMPKRLGKLSYHNKTSWWFIDEHLHALRTMSTFSWEGPGRFLVQFRKPFSCGLLRSDLDQHVWTSSTFHPEPYHPPPNRKCDSSKKQRH